MSETGRESDPEPNRQERITDPEVLAWFRPEGGWSSAVAARLLECKGVDGSPSKYHRISDHRLMADKPSLADRMRDLVALYGPQVNVLGLSYEERGYAEVTYERLEPYYRPRGPEVEELSRRMNDLAPTASVLRAKKEPLTGQEPFGVSEEREYPSKKAWLTLLKERPEGKDQNLTTLSDLRLYT